jgi:hypothetical protein
MVRYLQVPIPMTVLSEGIFSRFTSGIVGSRVRAWMFVVLCSSCVVYVSSQGSAMVQHDVRLAVELP